MSVLYHVCCRCPSITTRCDKIHVNSLLTRCIIGINPDERVSLQNVIISFTIHLDLQTAGETDALSHSLSYSLASKTVDRFVTSSSFLTVEALAYGICRVLCLDVGAPIATVRVDKPSALKFASSAAVEITRCQHQFAKVSMPIGNNNNTNPISISTTVTASKAIIGDGGFSHDSMVYNTVYLSLGCNLGDRALAIDTAITKLLQRCCDTSSPSSSSSSKFYCEGSIGNLVTSFLYETSPMYVINQPPFLNCCVRLTTTQSPLQLLATVKSIETEMGRALSNNDCDQMNQRWGPRVIDIDILFYNSLCLCTTTLTIPHPNLHERAFVLVPLCDIDPCLIHPQLHTTIYSLWTTLNTSMTDDLSQGNVRQVPVRRVCPLSIGEHPHGLLRWNDSYTSLSLPGVTTVMGILNITPDSFTDGGLFMDIDNALRRCQELIDEGVDIIDIGGQSTRKDAILISAEEEMARVLPVIQAIVSSGMLSPSTSSTSSSSPSSSTMYKKPQPFLSIDTFYASVAEAAVNAGVCMVNDVTGGTYDTQMFSTIAKLKVPFVCMHYRGSPSTMVRHTDYMTTVPVTTCSKHLSADSAVTNGVSFELAQRCAAAERAGIRRWHLIVDPGLGFAKTPQGSLELMRQLGKIVTTPIAASTMFCHDDHCTVDCNTNHLYRSYPILVGPSRKRFLSVLCNERYPNSATMTERDWATAGAVTVCISQGVEVVRLHVVRGMRDTIAIADAAWRLPLPK